MFRSLLLLLSIGMITNVSASEEGINQINNVKASYVSRVFSCITDHPFASILVGLAAFGVYKWVTQVLYQQEEHIFEASIQEPELLTVTKKDHDMVRGLIDAMEQDMIDFDAQPLRVKEIQFSEFDNEEMANGCEGMRGFFCTIYDQCLQEPDNRSILEEVVAFFRQTVEEKMVLIG